MIGKNLIILILALCVTLIKLSHMPLWKQKQPQPEKRSKCAFLGLLPVVATVGLFAYVLFYKPHLLSQPLRN